MTVDPVRVEAAGAEDIAAVAVLFRAYTDALGIDLGYQGFDAELAGLPGEYAPPRGALLVARDGDAVVGCVALRARGDVAEMKRLYVAPAGRGLGVGAALAQAAITEARRLGHAALVLDTLPDMTAAQALYRRLGFVPTAAYYAGAPVGTLFLRLDLAAEVA